MRRHIERSLVLAAVLASPLFGQLHLITGSPNPDEPPPGGYESAVFRLAPDGSLARVTTIVPAAVGSEWIVESQSMRKMVIGQRFPAPIVVFDFDKAGIVKQWATCRTMTTGLRSTGGWSIPRRGGLYWPWTAGMVYSSHILGMVLDPSVACDKSFAVMDPGELSQAVLSGVAGVAEIGGRDVMSVILNRKTGKLEIFSPNGSGYFDQDLPMEMFAGMDVPWTHILVNDSEIMAVSITDYGKSGEQRLVVLRKRDKTWLRVPKVSEKFAVRGFGAFLAITAAQAKDARLPESAGRAEWGAPRTNKGPEIALRMDEFPSGLSGPASPVRCHNRARQEHYNQSGRQRSPAGGWSDDLLSRQRQIVHRDIHGDRLQRAASSGERRGHSRCPLGVHEALTGGGNGEASSATPTVSGTFSGLTFHVADSGSLTASVTLSLTVTPGAPTLSLPAYQAVGQSTTPTLSWQAAAGATSYTLYLDTVNPPLQSYAVTGTSFTPSAALQGGDLYYWYVVGNNGSLAGPASSTWQFWVTGAASNVSVSPSSGGPPATGLGTPTRFTFTFSSPNGWQDIGWTQMLFNYYNIGSFGCFLGFWPGSQQVALVNNDPTLGWMWFGNLQQKQATAANSQCSVDLSQSSWKVDSPVQLEVTLEITFLAGLPGPQQIWMQAGDNVGISAPWQQMGSWTTSTVINQAPSTVSGTMPAQPGAGGLFTYVASSPNGWTYLTEYTTAPASIRGRPRWGPTRCRRPARRPRRSRVLRRGHR